jgi:hypothetical protein
MTEEWRAVLDGNYEVSNCGQFRRATPGRKTWVGRIMAPVLMKIGYYCVGPTVNGKNVTMTIHSLVAEAFLGERPEGASVNHKDGIKTNNHVSNLEYVTHAENMRHAGLTGLMAVGEAHGGAKFSDAEIREIRAARASGMSYSTIARLHSVSIGHVWQIIQGNARRSA